MLKLNLDCRLFRGEKPCACGRLCENCPHYDPMGTRVLIIKLDAIGDVARTTTILRALRRKYDPSHVTWLVAPEALDLLNSNPLVDVPLPYDLPALERLRAERFDLVLSLDKTRRAAGVATTVRGETKKGFGLSEYGTAYPLDADAEYAFQLGLDDDLKFRRNTRTYQDVIFEVCGLDYQRDDYEIPIPSEARSFATEFAAENGIEPGETLVGVNLGGGAMFAHKMWATPRIIEFLRLLRERLDCRVLLFGAERERETTETLLAAGIPKVHGTGLANTLDRFQALVGLCDVLMGGDTLGMHLALAERLRQVVLFGPTCPREIELYDRGEKIVSPLDCVPCYRKTCGRTPSCMEAIDAERVVEAVLRQLAAEEKA